jgi:fatty acid desaturase
MNMAETSVPYRVDQTDRPLPTEVIRELSVKSGRRGAVQLALHVALLAIGAGLIAVSRGHWWIWPAMLLHGWFLIALFAVVHECVHDTVFPSRTANRVVAWIASVPSLLNSTFYRQLHFAHHRYTQDPDRDPELTPPPPRTWRDYFWRLSGATYWRSRLLVSFRAALGDFGGMPYIPERERRNVQRSIWGMLAIAALAIAGAVVAGSDWPLVYWIGPLLMAQPILRGMLLAEHTGCSHGADGLSNTRSTLTPWFVRLVHWNMPFHAEHHMFPSIPFHALPKAHALVRNRLRHLSPGYLAAHREIVAAMRN